jgi:hypothetical protein
LDRQLDLIFRLFCLGQLFTCIRPYLLQSFVGGFETGGFSAFLEVLSSAWPPARWFVYLPCLAIVVFGARRPWIFALALGQVLDVSAGIWTNTLASGYSEKGLVVLLSVGSAVLLALDRGPEAERVARLRGFIRAAACVAFASIALNKVNSDFLNSVTSCARVLNEGLIKIIPFASPVAGPLASHASAALAMEALLLPVLLLRPRYGVVYTWGFFASVAMVGPRATCLVFMAIALSFLPAQDFERLKGSSRLVNVGLAASFFVALGFWTSALGDTQRFAVTELLARVGFLALALFGIGLMVANAWGSRRAPDASWASFRSGPPRVSLLAGIVLSLLVVNELAPYLGLKTKYSLTMWSNLRTDQGRSNSYVIPDFLRVSGRVDRALLHVSQIEPRTGSADQTHRSRRTQLVRPAFVAAHGTALAHLQMLEARFGPLSFEVGAAGDQRTFYGAQDGSDFASWVNATRPGVDWFEDAVMTVDAPQACLGP